MSEETYNGWKNRETWALNLWLSNDEGLYNIVRERVAQCAEEIADPENDDDQSHGITPRDAGETIKALIEELFDPAEELMSPANIITILSDVGSLYRVDWDEIGAAWLPEDED